MFSFQLPSYLSSVTDSYLRFQLPLPPHSPKQNCPCSCPKTKHPLLERTWIKSLNLSDIIGITINIPHWNVSVLIVRINLMNTLLCDDTERKLLNNCIKIKTDFFYKYINYQFSGILFKSFSSLTSFLNQPISNKYYLGVFYFPKSTISISISIIYYCLKERLE